MNFYTLLICATGTVTLLSCATPPSAAAMRKAHFENLPEKNARLESILEKREQADCDAQGTNVMRDAQPLVRIPPYMPQGAIASGSCAMKFDVNRVGEPVNIRTVSCTDDIFDYASRRSILQWKYNPRIADGKTVAMCDIQNKITFMLVDKKGNRIEPN